jgi:integrase
MRQRRPAHDAYDQRIFPYSPFSVSKLFTQACRDAKIEDLRLHDMRHEGTSRLFEAGWDIPEVAMVTGHRSWAHLKRYTNLKPTDIARKALSRAKGSSEAT